MKLFVFSHKRSIDVLNKVYHLHVRATKILGQVIVIPTLGYSEVDLVLLNSVPGSVKIMFGQQQPHTATDLQ
jgi:hypothetical protein